MLYTMYRKSHIRFTEKYSVIPVEKPFIFLKCPVPTCSGIQNQFSFIFKSDEHCTEVLDKGLDREVKLYVIGVRIILSASGLPLTLFQV